MVRWLVIAFFVWVWIRTLWEMPPERGPRELEY